MCRNEVKVFCLCLALNSRAIPVSNANFFHIIKYNILKLFFICGVINTSSGQTYNARIFGRS